jgi:hypothetical protein
MNRKLSLIVVSILLLTAAACATRVAITSPIIGAKLAYGGSIVLTANVEPADMAGSLTWSIVEGANPANGRISTNPATSVTTYYAPTLTSFGSTTRNLTIKAQVGDRTAATMAITIGRAPTSSTATIVARPAPVAALASSDLVVNQVTSVLPRPIVDTTGQTLYQSVGVEIKNNGPSTFNGTCWITINATRTDTGATYTLDNGPSVVRIEKDRYTQLRLRGPYNGTIVAGGSRLSINGWPAATWSISCTIRTDSATELTSNNTSRAYTVIIP